MRTICMLFAWLSKLVRVIRLSRSLRSGWRSTQYNMARALKNVIYWAKEHNECHWCSDEGWERLRLLSFRWPHVNNAGSNFSTGISFVAICGKMVFCKQKINFVLFLVIGNPSLSWAGLVLTVTPGTLATLHGAWCGSTDYVTKDYRVCIVLRVMTRSFRCKATLHVVTCMLSYTFRYIFFLPCF